MRQVSGRLIQLVIACLLAIPALKAQTPLPSQLSRGCIALDYVGTASSNPFTAERLTQSVMKSPDGTEKTMEVREKTARDGAGRVRFEKHARLPGDADEVTLRTNEGGTFTATNEMLKTSITIFDCSSGKTISIQPGLRVAYVRESDAQPAPPQRSRPYASLSSSLLGRKLPPEVSVEELGIREFDGIQARGIKVTNLGTEKDGEWNGKPVEIHETWASEDLAATILEIRLTPRTGNESTSTLTNIRRGEPEPSLFEIPQGYKVNPKPAEMPYQMLDSIPVVHQ